MIELLWSIDDPPEDMRGAIENAARAALAHEGREGDVCVQILDCDAMRAMNLRFRNMDAVTDVLTFPAWEGEVLLAPPDAYLGDIAICYPRALEQAAAYGHSLRRELCFLAVHGALHLCGYDHGNGEDEARMRGRQNEILRFLEAER